MNKIIGNDEDKCLDPASTTEQYNFLLKVICPFCRIGLPVIHVSGRYLPKQGFFHTIPSTEHEFKCVANDVRGRLVIKE